ncbi:L-rhamnose mutarotase [Prolixibacteraceae bacterium Z1-6]|uniref:L-rhamnose mutarotase n=1 Tax=Draconibacterium aestuarii TaxID=2998507 RepID=A0A9X3J8S6_9BACT|nr:L-rhamnose mutarotase [Prolixibacteraceae bacterium Z1-6]
MKRFGQTIKLKPDGAEEYIKHHAAVWPGVLAKIKECNLSNYSIFVRDTILFAYFEYTGSDFDADMKKMAAHEETQRWWDVVKPLMQPVDSAKDVEFWADMEEIFHLE